MLYAKAHIENGQLKLTDEKTVDQSTLTSDCWLIQIEGPTACTTCECLNKPRLCGGMKLRAKLGVPAPITRKRK